ncbi:MAG TPA: D-lyxose/D-mannose family sugar isomerase [Fimbriimonadaceae bacterium]|nr:D-lyxose/D-mannose family sugar isomerase [Fimbriimonadaceae bacterium]
MKRSEINRLVRDATACFSAHGWALPPNPRWDVTDFGLGDWRSCGLVLVNLAEEPEYCEKLMYARRGMVTPLHFHKKKKEDIICRWGELRIEVDGPVRVNGEPWEGGARVLKAGERVTLTPGFMHSFQPESEECVIGEVSTANDDLNDNFFEDARIGRFSAIEEDEPPLVRLVSER